MFPYQAYKMKTKCDSQGRLLGPPPTIPWVVGVSAGPHESSQRFDSWIRKRYSSRAGHNQSGQRVDVYGYRRVGNPIQHGPAKGKVDRHR